MRQLGPLAFENFGGFAGGQGVFVGGGDDANGDVILAGKEQSFADTGGEKHVALALGEVEKLSATWSMAAGLWLKEHLESGVGHNRLAVGREEKVVGILGNDSDTKVIFSGPFDENPGESWPSLQSA